MSSLNFDTSDFDEKINRLIKYENLEKIEKKVLRTGLAEIRKATKSQLKRELPNASKRNPMYDDRLIDGVMMSVVDEGQDMVGKVHVLGVRRKTSGTYRLRFFEGGTVDRVKKSTGKSTGHIKPLNFFETARNSSESTAMKKIEDEWDNQIDILLR